MAKRASNLGNFPRLTDSREKGNQGQFDFLRQKIWWTKKKKFRLSITHNQFFVCIDQDYHFFLLATIRPD
jgi:hypothetical protein